ncbi:hypothetical protein GTO89_00575 [Heliobacterium gestii]|uniref:Uncharacterized protein n=1 Tax=Heliomicrobium gestii TaxID=2699 RepID=A0A845LAG7_HELGE|nr:hypothetical protein [Heliomicrobium gestii]MBM7865260.1 hypothetical protein [Heliomicrobium gestii]MZP41525.1 hypothetical protein [Heliomicrobium gestii]
MIPQCKSPWTITLTTAVVVTAVLVGVFLFPLWGAFNELSGGHDGAVAAVALFSLLLPLGLWLARKKRQGVDGDDDGWDGGDVEADPKALVAEAELAEREALVAEEDLADRQRERQRENGYGDQAVHHNEQGQKEQMNQWPSPECLLDELVPPLNHSLGVIRCAVQVLEEEFGYRSDLIQHTRVIAVEAERQQQYLREAVRLLRSEGRRPDWLEVSLLLDGVLERFRKHFPGYTVIQESPRQEAWEQQASLKVWADGDRLVEALYRLLARRSRTTSTGRVHVRVDCGDDGTGSAGGTGGAGGAEGAEGANQPAVTEGTWEGPGLTIEFHIDGIKEEGQQVEGQLAQLAVEAQGGTILRLPGPAGEGRLILRMPPALTAMEPERLWQEKGFVLRSAPNRDKDRKDGHEQGRPLRGTKAESVQGDSVKRYQASASLSE